MVLVPCLEAKASNVVSSVRMMDATLALLAAFSSLTTGGAGGIGGSGVCVFVETITSFFGAGAGGGALAVGVDTIEGILEVLVSIVDGEDF